MAKSRYTQEDIDKYLDYMKDVDDLMKFEDKKISVYDSACNKMYKRFAEYRKVKNPQQSDKNNLVNDIAAIWDSSKAQIKAIIRNKPVKAAASIDNLLDTKAIIGRKNELVAKDEEKFLDNIGDWNFKFCEIYYRWYAGGEDRKKMLTNWKNNIINDKSLRPAYRQMDYIADTIVGLTGGLINDIDKIRKALKK